MAGLVSQMGVIATEVTLKQTTKGHDIVEVPVFFNNYVPGVGKTTLEAFVTVWGDKAKWLVSQASKHTKKDGTLSNGKGMPMFFIGYLYTNKFNGRNGEVKQNRMQALDVLYSEVPVFNSTGVIGSEVTKRTVNFQNGGTTTVVEVPVFFNGYIPGIGKTAFESFVTVWGEKAEWLAQQAAKHTKKDNSPTNGKGMPMDFVCYVHTHKYEKDSKEIKVTKTIAIDVKFTSSAFSSTTSTTSTTANNNLSSNQDIYNQKEEIPAAQEPDLTSIPSETSVSTGKDFELFTDQSPGTEDILAEFDAFLQDINNEQAI